MGLVGRRPGRGGPPGGRPARAGRPGPGGGPRPRRRPRASPAAAPPVDVAAADLDPADQDPRRDLPAGLGERLGAGAGRRPAGLAQPGVVEHPGVEVVGELARGRGRHTGPPEPLGGGLGDPLRDLEAAPAGPGRPGGLPGPDPVVGGDVVDAPQPARGGQDQGRDGVGGGQALQRRVLAPDPDHGRRHQAPGQEGPPGRRPHPGPAQHHHGRSVRNASRASRSLSASTPAAGNSGLGRVGWVLGDRDRVVGVGAVDDPARPQHHRGRPGGGLQGAPGPLQHPGPAPLLVAVGGVDQREQHHRVRPGQGPGEGRVAGADRDELELGAQQRRLVPRQPQHPLDPGVVLQGQRQLPGRRVQRPDQRNRPSHQFHLSSPSRSAQATRRRPGRLSRLGVTPRAWGSMRIPPLTEGQGGLRRISSGGSRCSGSSPG